MNVFTITLANLKNGTKRKFLEFLEVEDEEDPEIDIMIEKMPDGSFEIGILM